MNPPARAVYVPPRPNLGPEPERSAGTPAWIIAALTVALVAALLGLRWARRRGRRRRALSPPTPPENVAPAQALGPRARIIAASEAVRAALAERFGPHWYARTTEEIVSDTSLANVLEGAALEQLALFLSLADRAKFGNEPDEHFEPGAYGPDWDRLVEEVIVLLRSSAGASTKISG